MNNEDRKIKRTLFFLAFILVFTVALCFLLLFIEGRAPEILFPTGYVAKRQLDLIIDSSLLMLLIVIPVFFFMFAFAWHYRKSNKDAFYDPTFERHTSAEVIWWSAPFIIVLILGFLTWETTYELNPFSQLIPDEKPLVVQAVALDWKWLFLYPEKKIALLNKLVLPKEREVRFFITASAPMNSLWIPSLAGQMYAMPAMASQLHLIPEEKGVYIGRSSNLSGEGFAGMTFEVHVVDDEEFISFVDETSTEKGALTFEVFSKLNEPSSYVEPDAYSLQDPALFDQIMMQYMPEEMSHGH